MGNRTFSRAGLPLAPLVVLMEGQVGDGTHGNRDDGEDDIESHGLLLGLADACDPHGRTQGGTEHGPDPGNPVFQNPAHEGSHHERDADLTQDLLDGFAVEGPGVPPDGATPKHTAFSA